jgi:hypothetical protein
MYAYGIFIGGLHKNFNHLAVKIKTPTTRPGKFKEVFKKAFKMV